MGCSTRESRGSRHRHITWLTPAVRSLTPAGKRRQVTLLYQAPGTGSQIPTANCSGPNLFQAQLLSSHQASRRTGRFPGHDEIGKTQPLSGFPCPLKSAHLRAILLGAVGENRARVGQPKRSTPTATTGLALHFLRNTPDYWAPPDLRRRCVGTRRLSPTSFAATHVSVRRMPHARHLRAVDRSSLPQRPTPLSRPPLPIDARAQYGFMDRGEISIGVLST